MGRSKRDPSTSKGILVADVVDKRPLSWLSVKR